MRNGRASEEATPVHTTQAGRPTSRVTEETNLVLHRVLANLAEFCADTPSLDVPIPTDATWTYWPCADGEESRELWGNLTVQDRKVVEWDASRSQFIGVYGQ